MVPKSRCSPDAGLVRGGHDRGLVESMLDVGELLDVCARLALSRFDQMNRTAHAHMSRAMSVRLAYGERSGPGSPWLITSAKKMAAVRSTARKRTRNSERVKDGRRPDTGRAACEFRSDAQTLSPGVLLAQSP